MVSYDNYGRKVGEANVIVRPDGGVLTTNTLSGQGSGSSFLGVAPEY